MDAKPDKGQFWHRHFLGVPVIYQNLFWLFFIFGWVLPGVIPRYIAFGFSVLFFIVWATHPRNPARLGKDSK
jgi:hypothetical protein